MTDLDQLRESQANAEWWIARQLEKRITHPYKTCKHLGERLWGLLDFYRIRGILGYLLDADTEVFFSDLTREALTYVTLLKAHREKLDVPKERVNGSTYSPLVSALATGNFELATAIDELMPRRFGEHDAKEEFTFATVLRQLVVGSQTDIDVAQGELSGVAVGEERWASVLQTVEGLKEQRADTFNSGVAAYLASRETLEPEEVDELAAGEEFVSIEALAFIQLAKKRNLKTEVRHRMIPPELQEARPVTPKNGYPSWPG